MTEKIRRTRGVQTGPRSRQVVDRVIEATLAELDLVGYTGLTMDAVARRAGVNRTTLYRRWPKKRDLLAAALQREIARLEHTRMAGPLETALSALVEQLAANLSTREGTILAAALTSADPELVALSFAARRRVMQAVLSPFRSGLETGELPTTADIEMLAHLALYGTVHWVLERRGTISQEDRERLVGAILTMAAP